MYEVRYARQARRALTRIPDKAIDATLIGVVEAFAAECPRTGRWLEVVDRFVAPVP